MAMRDFIRFVLRGGMGSAIAGPLFTWLIFLRYFGPYWEQLYLLHPLVLACFAMPGAFVGFVLWIVTRFAGVRLTNIPRMAIGMGVVLTSYLVFVLWAVSVDGGWGNLKELPYEPVVWLLLWLSVVGGTAGLMSPSQKLFPKPAGLTYWDRVALYEIAKQEARLAGMTRAHSIGGEA
jgi:hypothetical protein